MTAPLSRRTPLAAVGRGLVAGVIGTAAMTVWQDLASRLRNGEQHDGDTAADQAPPEVAQRSAWEHAPAPAQVAGRIAEGVFHTRMPAKFIPVLTQAMHWAYGTGWGGLYGLVRDSADDRGLPEGLAFGTAVWSMSYVQLVPMGLYAAPWRYPPKELALDLSYHLVYGAATSAAYLILEP